MNLWGEIAAKASFQAYPQSVLWRSGANGEKPHSPETSRKAGQFGFCHAWYYDTRRVCWKSGFTKSQLAPVTKINKNLSKNTMSSHTPWKWHWTTVVVIICLSSVMVTSPVKECHHSSIVSGLHQHIVLWHIPWYTSCNLQGGSRMENCTILVQMLCAGWNLSF